MSLPEKNSRRDFLKFGALAGVGLGLSALPSAEAAPDPKALKLLNAQDISATRPRPAGNKPVWDLQTKPLQKVRCAFSGLSRGMTHVNSAVNSDFASSPNAPSAPSTT